MAAWQELLQHDGFVFWPTALTDADLTAAQTACARALRQQENAASILANPGGPAYGARNLLQLWPEVGQVIRQVGLVEPFRELLGPQAALVRGLYFDKPPGHSWALPWHRDRTMAVRHHGALGRFTKPTTKAGVPHVEAPVELLRSLVTLRLHLDPMTLDNGPLRVLPRSHLEDTDMPTECGAATLTCAAGAILLMRPLLLHASGHCAPNCTSHRRIVHLELAGQADLPDGYAWHDYVRLV